MWQTQTGGSGGLDLSFLPYGESGKILYELWGEKAGSVAMTRLEEHREAVCIKRFCSDGKARGA